MLSVCRISVISTTHPMKLLVSDYKMNLLQLRKSGSLRFHNPDVDTVFDVSRSIYEKDFQKINTVYKEKAIPAELGVVIGAITESQKLINHALQSEKKGGQIYMCGCLLYTSLKYMVLAAKISGTLYLFPPMLI